MKNITGMMNFRKIISRLKDWKISAKISFFVLGIASTLWFLIRVIPKPSRATYPCMRAAAPIMSGFIVYMLSISVSVFAFRKFGKKVLSAKYYAAAGFLAIAVTLVFVASSVNNSHIKAAALVSPQSLLSNAPIGTATGLKPGRVMWIYNPDATNENCTNVDPDFWYKDVNTDQLVVDTMLANGIRMYAGSNNLKTAWDALFKYFNGKHSKGDVGYTAGEKIVVKLNMTNMGAGGRDLADQMDATPQLMLALLDELINVVGVAQADITMGDPYRGFGDFYWDKCHGKYPNVHYIDGSGTDGRELTQISTSDVFYSSNTASDHIFSSRLPQAYLNAAYLINMPCLKTHESAGITIAAKNHQGSMIGPDQDATNQGMGNYLHYDYPETPENEHMGLFRHIVDYMAHSKLGGNTLVYIVDAIWTGRNWEGYVDKWGMAPFNGDYPSSLFISQDPVAIESVGYDFLFYEYTNYPSNHESADFPLRVGVNDYILQAADSVNWPTGIIYNPNNAAHTSRGVRSLGVYEHWNNATDKKYSRNLGTGDGIELLASGPGVTTDVTGPKMINNSMSLKCYPNPVSNVAHFSYTLEENANVRIDIFSMNGSLVSSITDNNENAGSHKDDISLTGSNLADGQYICRIIASNNGITSTSSVKFQFLNRN
jgi:Domain of unknown function (DUF362)/Secretion system C-terminal sorting domain